MHKRKDSVANMLAWTLITFLTTLQCAHSQRNSGRSGSSNLKDALLVYPTGIRSERDLPVCPTFIEEEKDAVTTSLSPGLSNGFNGYENRLHQPGSTKTPSDSKKSDSSKGQPKRYMSACNIIHRRYFYQPMIQRLCRCPDRTECPMQWSPPPSYKDLFADSDATGSANISVSTTPTTKAASNVDPFTVMVSSRSQLKFCAEIATNLPTCGKPPKSHHNKEPSPEETASMKKTITKTFLTPELPSVTVSCYCPPLYREWTFVAKNQSMDLANGTSTETIHYYRCDRMRSCKSGQQCGTVRTDFHFSYYHCSCPKKHLCVPKVYPPESAEDVVEDAEEALYSGQVAPAVCTPE